MGQQTSVSNPDGGNEDIDNEIDLNVEVSEPVLKEHAEATLDLNTSKFHEEMELPKEAVKPINPEELVQNAIKHKKVFAITGGYSTVRHSLRSRGWVEKFYNIPFSIKKTSMAIGQKCVADISDLLCGNDVDDDGSINDDKIDDVENDHQKVPPWEEDGGIYGDMSRMLHDVTPTLFWVLRRDTGEYHSFLTRRQMVNHYGNVACFTTKAGLCANLKNIMWFTDVDADSFFPRCYLISNDEEKQAFIDDFRLTACMNIIKEAVHQLHKCMQPKPSTADEDSQQQGSNVDACPSASDGDIQRAANEDLPPDLGKSMLPENAPPNTQKKKRKKKHPVVPTHVLEVAVYQCEKVLACKTHEDLDMPSDIGALTEEEWQDLIEWSYQLIQEEGHFNSIPIYLSAQCESLMERLPTFFPQFEINGKHNVWIVKPGAMSRGRGIKCFEKLTDILALVSSSAAKIEGKYVVQKYIEHPLLIYNTKFDIRQWFLVTDWNPLTVWFYQDSYLRFCSRQFTLEDFSESIHLSNNAIQKHYKNGPRSPLLPPENMWSSEQFKRYLQYKGDAAAWDTKIYPQMKQAVIGALLVSQDIVHSRKSSFELYGADFMLTEDLSPWLLEINASPSMEPSTAVTTTMCRAVLEDTIKVVIDRKRNKNCNTGRFELAFKQPHISALTYTGVSLAVLGHAVAKPSHKESCVQKRCSANHAPVDVYSMAVQQMSDNNAGDDSQPSSNFSMLGVKDILNNIIFYNRNQVKPSTKSSCGLASPHNFLYTIPRSLKQANSAGTIQRKNIHNKRTAVKAKHGQVSQSHRPSARDKSCATNSESVENGASQQSGRQHTFRFLPANQNCLCRNCSFVLNLPNHINTKARSLSNLKGHQLHNNKIQYSISKSPQKKRQRSFNTISSCVTGSKETATAKLIQPTPHETLGLTLARPTSAHCFGSNSSVSLSIGPVYQMTDNAYSQSSYQNPCERDSWTQKNQYCNSCFGSVSGAFGAVQKNQNLSQNLFHRTFTPDFTSMRRADG
ncbi:hypothetical protein BsWGS_13741 [Bradybaena similaris]